jgi:hypothetical protein
MKILDTPRSGKLGLAVAFQSRYGLCLREWLAPKNTITPARERAWSAMGYFARAWSAKLTDPQRERWIVAAGNVLSATRMDCGPLTGQQFFESINCARACINREPFFDAPPAKETFAPNPVGALSVVNGPQGLRLLLAVTGPITEDIMVFGQVPCSLGRHKRRNVAYLGLLPVPEDGFADITDIYVAKYGPLRPDTKIFIVTRQQKNGWEGPDKETSARVPPAPELPQAPAQPASPSSIYMHTGGTGDAQGIAQPPTPCSPEGKERVPSAKTAAETPGTAGGVANDGPEPPGG